MKILLLLTATATVFGVNSFRETRPLPQAVSAQTPLRTDDETTAPKTFVMPVVRRHPAASPAPLILPQRVEAKPVTKPGSVCSSDDRSNAASIYQGKSTGNTPIMPLPGKDAARVRSHPSFGSNVLTCLLPDQTVTKTGTLDGIWSQVQLGDGSPGWISTSQLSN